MSLIKKEKAEKSTYTLEFSVSKEVFNASKQKAYKKNIGKMNIPGFRKGKAPLFMVEKLYGQGVFFEDAINDCMPAAFEEALKESKLNMVGQPDIDIKDMNDEAVVFIAKVAVKPDVKIENYLGIEVERDAKTASDEDIDADIERTRKSNARTIDVTDRAAQNGDIANINFEGFVDGKAFDGGKAEGHSLTLGSGQFIPGFEDQIVGKSIGEEFDVNVTFPEDYQAKELAGKPAVFKCKLNALKVEELPVLDDEFAKDVSEFDTFAEYKESVKAKIQERYDKEADAAVEEKLLETLMENMKADIPEAMFVAETENYVRDYDSRLRMQGLDLKTYFQYTGMDLDKLREQLRPQAEKQVKVRLVLEKIAKAEKLTAGKKDVDAEYKRIAEAYNVPEEQVRQMVASDDIALDLKVKAAMDLVKEKAVIKNK